MASIFDIGRPCEPVSVTGEKGIVKLNLYGISFDAIVGLLIRFPEMRSAVLGGHQIAGVSGERVIEIGSEALGAVIAAGLDSAGDAKTEAAARKLGLGVQASFVRAIFRLTMPDGPEVFRQQLQDLGIMGLLAPTAGTPEAGTPVGMPAGSSPQSPPGIPKGMRVKSSPKRSKA